MSTKLFPSLTEEQHIALAVAAITVNQLEWLIEHLVEAGMPEQKNIAKEMLVGNGFDRFLSFAKAILLDVMPEAAARTIAMCDEIQAVRKKRHKVMHWVWGAQDVDKKATMLGSVRPFRKVDLQAVSLADLEAITADADKLSKEVLALMNELRGRHRDKVIKQQEIEQEQRYPREEWGSRLYRE